MTRKYSLSESAALLGVDPATLRRWRSATGGIGERGPADRRRAWLSRADLAELARSHGRVLVVDAAPGADQVGELAARIAELEARLVDLEEWRELACRDLLRLGLRVMGLENENRPG